MSGRPDEQDALSGSALIVGGRVNEARLSMTWPLVALFVLFPLWWALGVVAFVFPAVAVLMVVAMLRRGWTQAPAAILVWLAFGFWVLLSELQLPLGTKVITANYRLALYATAAIIFIYAYNMPRWRGIDRKLVRVLTVFWIVVVAGGYLGMLLGSTKMMSPIEYLLPHSLRTKGFVIELVQPVFAQVQNFLGFPVPRPAAPFAYTNQWGGNIAVLTVIAIASLSVETSRRWRKVIIGVMIASVVPMVVSLNRGMLLSLALGLVYIAVRLALRGRVQALASILVFAAIMVVVVIATPLGHLVAQSFSSTHGHSNATRLSLYTQAAAGANSSPLFGYGAPQQSSQQLGLPAVGTQGQFWMVLYSNGYPALILFVASVLMMVWQTRRARGVAGVCFNAAILVALAQTIVYGWLPYEAQVVMLAAAIAYRMSAPLRRYPAGNETATRIPSDDADAGDAGGLGRTRVAVL